MKRILSWYCKLFGHKPVVDDPWSKVDYCARCDAEFEGDAFLSPLFDIGLVAWWYYTLRHRNGVFRRITDGLSRCPMCGKRFCRLPDDDIHMPF